MQKLKKTHTHTHKIHEPKHQPSKSNNLIHSENQSNC